MDKNQYQRIDAAFPIDSADFAEDESIKAAANGFADKVLDAWKEISR